MIASSYACQTCMTKYAYWFNVTSALYNIFKEINKKNNCNYDNVIVIVLTGAWKTKCINAIESKGVYNVYNWQC